MRDIVFYDFDFNRVADFPKFTSFNIERKYCGYGCAEIHYSLSDSEIINMLEENPYLFFVAGEYAAIVTGWRVGEDIAVFGRTLEWLLTRRGVKALSFSGSSPEVIVRAAVRTSARDIVTIGDEYGIEMLQDYSTDKVKIVYDVICEVLSKNGLGFSVVPNFYMKRFIFSVYQGRETLCLISQSNRTAFDMTYTVEKQDMVTNSGWYEQRYTDMGGWDAYNNSPSLSEDLPENAYKFYQITSETTYKSGEKYYPVEKFGFVCTKGCYVYCDSESGKWKITNERPDTVWVYLDNSNQTGIKKWDAVLSGEKTKEEALIEIAELKRKDHTQSETKSVVYGEDYNLGDIVRVQTEFGSFKKDEKKRVTAVKVYYDIDKSGVVPVLNSLEE